MRPIQKLRLDFARQARLGRDMDEDTAELIARLCTRIGMIMEDASVVALTIGATDEAEKLAALDQLVEVSGRTKGLAQAARSLAE